MMPEEGGYYIWVREAMGLRERKGLDLIACPSCGRAEVDGHVGDRRRGLDAREDHVPPGGPDAARERLLEPNARGARVAADDQDRACRYGSKRNPAPSIAARCCS